MNTIPGPRPPATTSPVDPPISHPPLELDDKAWAADGELGEAQVGPEPPPEDTAQAAPVVATFRRERRYVSEEVYY